MATTKDFDSYDMQVSGGTTGRVALILCYKGNSFVGRVDFQADGTALSSDFLWHPASPTITSIVLQMPMSRFDVVVNTLRQERPLKLHIDVDYQGGATTAGHGYLGTGIHEPVGELMGVVRGCLTRWKDRLLRCRQSCSSRKDVPNSDRLSGAITVPGST